jgi:hypothetical protein
VEKHSLKTLSPYFEDVCSGKKDFEIRKNDRDYKTGDLLILRHYVIGKDGTEGQFTGPIVTRKIKYILKGGNFGLADGYVILGLHAVKYFGN